MKKRLILTNPKITTLLLAAAAAVFLSYRVLSSLFYPTSSIQALDLNVANILQAVNTERANRNITTLNTNAILSSAADYKAHDMVTRKYFSHTDPEGNYIWPKIVSLGYAPYTMLGENLAIEFYSTESLMQAWMDSPTHRANVLQEGFRDTGAGLAFGNTQNGEYGTSIANTFGTLAPKKTTPPPAPPKPAAKPAPKPAAKPVAKKVAPPTKKRPIVALKTKVKAAEQTAEQKVTEAVEEIKNLNPITPRGVALALLPLLPKSEESTGEPNMQIGQNEQPPAVPEISSPTPAYQETQNSNSNPYKEYRLWAILIAIGALGLLSYEAKQYIKDKIHIPRHRWNTILMLILTLFVTVLAYVI